MNHMGIVVPLGRVGKNFDLNIPGTQFQGLEATTNILRKSGPLGHFWARNLRRVLTEEKEEIWAKLEHTAEITAIPSTRDRHIQIFSSFCDDTA
jgi:hypothetical protein